MGCLVSRLTVIGNDSEVPVEIRECPKGDPHGASCSPIVLKPNEWKFITSRKYYHNSIDAGIPRVIKLYSNGVRFRTLSPNDFMTNIKLKVVNNHDGQLDVRRVTATAADQFRIKAWECFLGNITGRTEEPLRESATYGLPSF